MTVSKSQGSFPIPTVLKSFFKNVALFDCDDYIFFNYRFPSNKAAQSNASCQRNLIFSPKDSNEQLPYDCIKGSLSPK